jgi:ABC-type multidrug transport system ATPase subunit
MSGVHEVAKETITIGRRPDSDVVVNDLLVSRRHAELRRGEDGGWTVVDLGSHNGVFLNGQAVSEAPVGPEDLIGVGHQSFRLVGNELQEYEDTGDGAFQALGLGVDIDGKQLLEDVSFALPPRSLLAIIGPSGAGKSTLLSALTGFRPADEGHVSYGGRDLYKNYSDLRQRIGLVPQQDILHTQLTVRTALRYAAKLRFPSDVDRSDRNERIEEVLETLGLTAQAGQRIDTLSGGQRKRTSVALELLTKPSLLFLDEPTSGLDPGLDKSVMNTLRELSDDGRTVVVVTHSVAHLDVCDRLLVLASGGRVAYFGPPSKALTYFGQKDFADVFIQLERRDGEEWAQRFESSPDYEQYLGSRLGPVEEDSDNDPLDDIPKRQGLISQYFTLTRRYAAVVRSDRQYLVFLVALPLVLSLFARIVPASAGLSVRSAGLKAAGEITPLLLVLIMAGCLMGSAASVRELVKERAIYRRELTIGLSPLAYLASKLLVLAIVVGLQAAAFTYLGLYGRRPPDDPLVLQDGIGEIALTVMAAGLASMLIGLLISAMVSNADRPMPLVVLVVMAQLVLSGALIPLNSKPGVEQLSWATPARWGFAAAAASSGLPDINPPVDPQWNHSRVAFTSDLGNLGVIAGAAGFVTLIRLRRLRPKRRRGGG